MLEDYYWDIEILALEKIKNGQGYISTWVNAGTFRGLINKKMPNVSYVGGKINEVSEYKAMGELNDALLADRRLRYDGYIYRIKGKPKDCIGLGHHVSMDLDYIGYDQDNPV